MQIFDMCIVVWRRLVSGAIDAIGAPVEVSCDVVMQNIMVCAECILL